LGVGVSLFGHTIQSTAAAAKVAAGPAAAIQTSSRDRRSVAGS
jgi:hypothetical protein